jgi:micrococcal nuclease
MQIPAYTYRAVVMDVHDGDTVTLKVDLGLRVYTKAKVRLSGTSEDPKEMINAPELSQADGAGVVSRSYLHDLLMRPDNTGKEVIVQTRKDSTEKYGRWLGMIWITQQTGAQECVNDLMIKNGHAVGTRKLA